MIEIKKNKSISLQEKQFAMLESFANCDESVHYLNYISSKYVFAKRRIDLGSKWAKQ